MIFDIPILLCLSIKMSLTLHFCYAEAYKCHIMIGGQQWSNGYLCLSLKIFQSFPSKRVIRVLSTRDNLILLITNKSHKNHLLSYAQRCSSKLQMIQSLEDFVSMAIQGTQVPLYTKHTLFLYFSDFSIFFIFLYEKQNKAKLKNNQTKTC